MFPRLQAQQEHSPQVPPDEPSAWLRAFFPRYVSDSLDRPVGFAEHHADMWRWVWALERGIAPPAYVGIWPRGGAKSTTAELAVARIGAVGSRSYALYVSETQEQADDHVANIGSMLGSPAFEAAYPLAANRLLDKYGNSKGWRRNRLRTASGLTIDALGLDTAARGAKMDEARPDLMVFDDLDSDLDTAQATQKKIAALTKKLIPAGSSDLAILAIQNLVQPDGIFARLADGRADFMHNRTVSGPIPALEEFAYEAKPEGGYRIVSGIPTWEGQDLARCQKMLDEMGLSAFLAECQHDVDEPEGGLFAAVEFLHIPWDEQPVYDRSVCWVDPAVTDTDQSDSHAISISGVADGQIYRIWSWEGRTSPEDSIRRAITAAVEHGCSSVGFETDQGGDTWRVTYFAIASTLKREDPEKFARIPSFREAKAGAGHGSKAHRASLMLADYERGKVTHVIGTHTTLERALKRFPVRKPYDLTDAAYWSWADLRNKVGAPDYQVGRVVRNRVESRDDRLMRMFEQSVGRVVPNGRR